MASWSFASQLFLVALFSWSVHALPDHIGLIKSDSEDTRVNPGPQNAKAKSSFLTSKATNSSVIWVIARPNGLVVRPSKQLRPAFSQVANPPKLRPALAQNAEGPAVLRPVETPIELPAPESPVVSWAVESLKKLPPPQSPEDPVESLLPQNPDAPAGLPIVDFLEPLPPENPDVPASLPVVDFLESLSPPESTDAPAGLPKVDALENLLPPPSIPNSPAVSWLVDPAIKLPFPSSPKMPSVPWKVGRPKKFPSPPPTPEASADKWLAEVAKAPTLSKKQDSIPGVNAPKGEPPGHPPKTGAADVTSLVQPPKRTLLPPSPQSPGASWGTGTEALNNQLTSDPRLPPVEPEETYPSKGDLEQDFSKGEDIPLPFAYPAFPYRGGELSESASLYEQGSSAHESEDYGFVPKYPYAAGGLPLGVRLPAPVPYLKQVSPNLFYLFMTGQLPHGTVSHMQTDYEAGGDHASHFGYERFLPPRGPGIPHKKVSIKQS